MLTSEAEGGLHNISHRKSLSQKLNQILDSPSCGTITTFELILEMRGLKEMIKAAEVNFVLNRPSSWHVNPHCSKNQDFSPIYLNKLSKNGDGLKSKQN